MRTIRDAAFAGLLALCCCAVYAADSPTPTSFSRVSLAIEPQPLRNALSALASQSGLQMMWRDEDLLGDGITSPRIVGMMSIKEALDQLLSKSGLTYEFLNERTVRIARARSVPISWRDSGSPDLRMAQADGRDRTDSVAGSSSNDTQANAGVHERLQEVVVTGSRLLRRADEVVGTKVYARDAIERSGQTTVADFLNTLPAVSVGNSGSGLEASVGATSVTLHGLPLGTTLLLINGRRVQSSPAQQNTGVFFDLNSIPFAAVDRVEVVSEGSSAVYGSDAIGGVVNIVLKKNYEGIGATLNYGGATGTSDATGSLAWGQEFDRASLSLIGSYQKRSPLQGFDRASVVRGVDPGNADPGFDFSGLYRNACSPGNVFFLDGFSFDGGNTTVPYAGVPRGLTGTATSADFARTAGSLNTCANHNPFSYADFIPASERYGVLFSGTVKLTSDTELFSDVMYSNVRQEQRFLPSITVFGSPDLPFFTVDAANPYNPFGQTVSVALVDPTGGLGRYRLETQFGRAVVGARGSLRSWSWELAALGSQETSHYFNGGNRDLGAIAAALNSTDPATALNPFVDAPSGSSAFLQSLVFPTGEIHYRGRTETLDGFLRGDVVALPAGPLSMVVGAQYEKDLLATNNISDVSSTLGGDTFDRSSYAVYSEANVPLIRAHYLDDRELLSVGVAGRYDHYSDFGGKTTPQYSVQLRPMQSLTLRATYSEAFKAPSLYALDSPETLSQSQPVPDPSRNNQVVFVDILSGGNRTLRPEEGISRTIRLSYVSPTVPQLRFSVGHWSIDETDSVQAIDYLTIFQNESLFPGYVTRDASGNIVSIRSGFANFGSIRVRGFDGDISYGFPTSIGTFEFAAAATQTYRFTSALIPGAPPIDGTGAAQDSGRFSPRWKGVSGVHWAYQTISADVAARYTGRYSDYDTTRELGNFWLIDASLKWDITRLLPVNGAHASSVTLGAVNLFNRLPQNSSYLFGTVGYDPTQSDIRGRFIYGQISLRF